MPPKTTKGAGWLTKLKADTKAQEFARAALTGRLPLDEGEDPVEALAAYMRIAMTLPKDQKAKLVEVFGTTAEDLEGFFTLVRNGDEHDRVTDGAISKMSERRADKDVPGVPEARARADLRASIEQAKKREGQHTPAESGTADKLAAQLSRRDKAIERPRTVADEMRAAFAEQRAQAAPQPTQDTQQGEQHAAED